MQNMNEFKKNSSLNIITDLGGKIIILVMGIILPKLYVENFGSDVNGLLSSINNILIYVNLLEAGIGGAATQSLYDAIAKKDQNGVNGIMSATNIFYKRTGIYFSIIVCILCILYPYCVASELPFWLISSLVFLSSVPSVIKYFFQGKYTILLNADNRAYVLNTVTLASTVVTNFFRIILILLGMNIIIVQLSYIIVSLLQMLCVYVIVKKRYKSLNLSVCPNKSAVNKSKYVLIHTISATIFSNIDVLVLTFFCDLKTVSIYSIYNTIYLQISQIIKSISNGTKASFGQMYTIDKKHFQKSYTIFKIGYRYMAGVLLTAAAVTTMPFIRIYTSNFTDANYLSTVYPIMFFISNYFDVIRWPEVVAVNATGFFQETAKQAVFEMIINLSLSLLLVSKYGINGVLIATIVSLLYRTVDFFYFVSKNLVDDSWIKDTIYMIVTSGLSVAIIYLAECKTPLFSSWALLFLYAMIAVILCGLFYIVIVIGFYKKLAINTLRQLISILKRN